MGTAETISAMPRPTNKAARDSTHDPGTSFWNGNGKKHTEKADDNPANRHDARSTCYQAILKKAWESELVEAAYHNDVAYVTMPVITL